MAPSSGPDAIVIGTGAGGACVAYELAMAGVRTLSLEKGPWRRLDDFLEGGAFGHPFNSRGRGDEIKYTSSHFLMPRKEVRYLQYSEHGGAVPKPSPTEAGWMSQLVGGGTVHYGGASFRYAPLDLSMRTVFGDATLDGIDAEHQADLRDWPIGHQEMLPWYEKAERLIGVAGADGSGLPPLRFNKAAKRIDEALRRCGSPIQIIPTPMAINSGRHMGRDACHHSGLCQEYACRFEAKSDMRVTVLRAALQSGHLTIRPNVFARRLETNNGRVTGVECVVGHPEQGPRIEMLSAPVVVVACEAIESIRLLLASGIGNPAAIGRYLMFHVTGGARSIAPTPTTTWDTAPHTAYIRSFYETSSNGAAPFLKAGILLPSSVGGPLQEGGRFWGAKALTFYNEIYPFKMDLSYIGEGLPTRHNRVELVAEKDRYGMPGTVIAYRPHPFDLNAGRYVAARCKEILTLADGVTEDTAATHIKPFLKKETTSSRLFHCTGGCRFGEDPRTSALDPSCRVHDIDNLYVADASFMPTGGGANPTLTIQANGLRVGALIAERLGKGEQ